MNTSKISFYDEVKVVDVASPYFGQLGAVLGISEEGGIVYGYAVLLHGSDQNIFMKVGCIIPTGVSFTRDKFY